MADIVERLRLFVPHCEDPNDYLEDELLFLKAADEIERLRWALHTIFCNTEPDAIKHRDYDHLAKNICEVARTALEEEE